MNVKVFMTLCLINTIGSSQAMMRNVLTKLSSTYAAPAQVFLKKPGTGLITRSIKTTLSYSQTSSLTSLQTVSKKEQASQRKKGAAALGLAVGIGTYAYLVTKDEKSHQKEYEIKLPQSEEDIDGEQILSKYNLPQISILHLSATEQDAYLEEHFDHLTAKELYKIIRELPSSRLKEKWVYRIIYTFVDVPEDFFNFLSDKEKRNLGLLLLEEYAHEKRTSERNFNESSILDFMPTEKHQDIHAFLRKNCNKVTPDTLKRLIIEFLPSHYQAEWALWALENNNYFDIPYSAFALISLLSPSNKKLWALKLLEHIPYPEISMEQAVLLIKQLDPLLQHEWAMKILDTYCTITNLNQKLPWEDIPFLIDMIYRTSKDKQEEVILKLIEFHANFYTQDYITPFILLLPSQLQKQLVIRFMSNPPRAEAIQKVLSRKTRGPLFSKFFEKFSKQIKEVLEHQKVACQNFDALVEDIADYVEQEYAKNRIVFFHGRHSRWIFLEKFFRALHAIKHRKQPPQNFSWLRFKETVPPSQDPIEQTKLNSNGIQHPEHLLFLNLNLFENTDDANSYSYAIGNYDQATSHKRFDFDTALKTICSELGFSAEFENMTTIKNTEGKTVFDELYDLDSDAIQDQGNFGEVLVISMPRETADKITYACNPYGKARYLRINDQEWTSSSVKIADHFDDIENFNIEFCAFLGPEMCTPEGAAQAGVAFQGFDPTVYQRTEKYLKSEAKLNEVMALFETMYKARLAREALAQQNK